ncbi:MAG: type II and III secretion system protein, partial [Spirochaetaceae bacterium]|nr:type II and III secretion system protein [Spirochaetaceae bacterium]
MKIQSLILLFTLFTSALYAETIQSMEFRNQAIIDILLVLGKNSGNSIVPDETVKGEASYFFSNTDFETALSLFLSTYNYF